MFTVTMWFYCLDRLSIKHEVVRTFTGENEDEVIGKITHFRKQLKDAGWTVVRAVKQRNLAHLPER